jgi:transposase-like protein
VALEALKGIKTVSEIAQENEIHPVQVSAWKKELQGRLGELFERKNAADPDREARERNVARLERKVGQLLIEKEFLEKKCEQLGIDLSERP